MKSFMDTYGFLAWMSPDDQDHTAVTEWLAAYSGTFVTTEWVLVELADALASPRFRVKVSAFITNLREDPSFEIIPYDSALYRAAFDLYASRPDKGWSLTDCISFTVMADRGLTEALTADRHFAQAGFRAIFKK